MQYAAVRACRSRIGAVLLVALVLPGCFGGKGGDGGGNDQPSSTSGSQTTNTTGPSPPPTSAIVDLLLNFNFHGCRGATAMVAVPTADAQALLPAGFTVAPSPFGEPDRAALAVDIFSCNNLTTPSAAVQATWYGQAYTFIERPTTRVPASPEADVHEYLFRTLAGRDVLFDLWVAAGYDTYQGDPTLEWTQPQPVPALPPPPAAAVTASIGNYTLTVQGGPPVFTLGRIEATFARYTVLPADNLTPESILLWSGTYSLPTTLDGSAIWQVDGADKFAPFRNASGQLQGLAILYDAGDMTGMNLRRHFQSPA